MITHDCPGTLTDTEVLEFCKQGYLMLPGVVSEETNQRTLAYTDANPSHEPTEIIQEPWFRDEVLLNPAVAGAVRSLLGAQLRAAQSDEQSPHGHACTVAGMAPRWRFPLHSRTALPPGLLPCLRTARTTWAPRRCFRALTSSLRPHRPWGTTVRFQGMGQDIGPGGFRVFDRLLDLAPPRRLPDTVGAPTAQVQLLAHDAAHARLADRRGLRPGQRSVPPERRADLPSPVRDQPRLGPDVLLAVRHGREVPHDGRSGMAHARQIRGTSLRLPHLPPNAYDCRSRQDPDDRGVLRS